MEFKDCAIGIEVVPNFAEMSPAQRQTFTEGKSYIIHSLFGDLIRIEDDNGVLRSLNPKRFNPAIVYDEDFFYVGDIVKRKADSPKQELGVGELRVTKAIYPGFPANQIPRNRAAGIFEVERLDGVALRQDRSWSACNFDFVRHAGPAIIPKKIDGVFEPGDKVYHVPSGKYAVFTIKGYFPDTGKVTVEEAPGVYAAKSFAHVQNAQAKPAPPKPPEPVWPELDESLMDDLTKQSKGGVCNYALKTVKGAKHIQPSAACHAGLGAYAVPTGERVHTLACNVSSHYNLMDDETKKYYAQHTEYIINESPWAKYFHKRPIEDVLKGGVFMDVSNPHSHVVTACIALRMGHEHSPKTKMKVFARAIELGYNKHIAFIVAHTTTFDGNKVVPWHNGGWHHCINSDHNAKSLCEFFQNGYTRGMKEAHTKDGLKRYEIQSLVAAHGEQDGVKRIRDNYLNAKGAKTVKGKWGEDEVVLADDFDTSLSSLCETLVPFFK